MHVPTFLLYVSSMYTVRGLVRARRPGPFLYLVSFVRLGPAHAHRCAHAHGPQHGIGGGLDDPLGFKAPARYPNKRWHRRHRAHLAHQKMGPTPSSKLQARTTPTRTTSMRSSTVPLRSGWSRKIHATDCSGNRTLHTTRRKSWSRQPHMPVKVFFPMRDKIMNCA